MDNLWIVGKKTCFCSLPLVLSPWKLLRAQEKHARYAWREWKPTLAAFTQRYIAPIKTLSLRTHTNKMGNGLIFNSRILFMFSYQYIAQHDYSGIHDSKQLFMNQSNHFGRQATWITLRSVHDNDHLYGTVQVTVSGQNHTLSTAIWPANDKWQTSCGWIEPMTRI